MSKTAHALWAFGLIPGYAADPRSLNGLTAGELRCYLAIGRFMSGRTWTATVGVDRIAELAGMHPRNARKHLRSLAEKGWITCEQRSGLGGVNVYAFAPPCDGFNQSPSDNAGCGSIPSVESGNSPIIHPGDRRPPEGATEDPIPRTPPRAKPGTPPGDSEQTPGRNRAPDRATEDPPNNRTVKNNSNSSPVAAGCAQGEVCPEPEIERSIRAELLSAGISPGKVLDELASGGLALDEVRETVRQWRSKPGKGVGVLVNDLRGAITCKQHAKPTEQGALLGEGVALARKQRDKEHDEDQRFKEEEQKATTWAANVSDTGLVEAYERMIVENPRSVGACLRPQSDDPATKANHIRNTLAVEVFQFAKRGKS